MTSFLAKVFYLFFFLLFLLSIFLIEGEYKFYLFATWSIFLFFFNRLLKKTEISRSTIFALILSVLFIIGVIFSRQIPLSLEKLLFYLVSLATFIFFSSFSKGSFKPKTFFYYLSILTLTINLLVLFFTFDKDQHNLFPGMNLLVRSYGHNHYAAFLLLTTPIFWWQFLFKNEKNGDATENRFLMILLLISSYLLIILSLARLVLIISLFQLIIIFFTNKKSFSLIKDDDVAKVVIKTFIFAFLSIAMMFLFLSVPLNQKGESICPLIFSKKEICKPLLQNDRFTYWQKAWLIFKENPSTGVGLKNFNFASRKFPIKDYQLTSYAHNIFLHNLAEGGFLVGGFFVFFIIYVFYRSFVVMRKNGQPLHAFLWLAALTSLFNAMFDFDWNFFVIFTLTLIFLGIILQDDDKVIKKLNFKWYYAILMAITVLFASYDFGAKFLYRSNKFDQIVKYFPYSDRQIRMLLSEKKLSSDNFDDLYALYHNDTEYLYKFISSGTRDSERKTTLQIEWAKIDPPAFVNSVSFEDLNFKTALPLANKYVETVYEYNFLNNLNFLDYWDQKNMAQQFFNFANKAYLANDTESAAKYYKNVIALNEFIIEDREVAFLNETNFAQAAIFLNHFKDSNPEKMGNYFDDYMNLYKNTLLYLFKNNLLEDFFVLADAMFKQQYNFSWFLFRDLVEESVTTEDRQRLLIVHDHYREMTTWNDFLWLLER